MGKWYCSSVETLCLFLREYFGVGEQVWFHVSGLPEGLTPPDGPEEKIWAWLHKEFEQIYERLVFYNLYYVLIVDKNGMAPPMPSGKHYGAKRNGENFDFFVGETEKRYLPIL